jgi:polyribonucleotide nucleotidyltransferase
MIVVKRVEMRLAGRDLKLETGKMAKQADGAVVVQYGETVVLVTVVASDSPKEGSDFLPLTVDYREKTYAAGKIPGGFFKREGRPREKEILTDRLVDRPLRPLFPKGFKNEIQIIVTVLSSDQANDADVLAIIGASAALAISGIPFAGPVGAMRMGQKDGKFIINPTFQELEDCDLNLIVVGTKEGLIMVEGSASEVSEEVVLEAIELAHGQIKEVVKLQDRLSAMIPAIPAPKRDFVLAKPAPEVEQDVRNFSTQRIYQAKQIKDEATREEEMANILAESVEHVGSTLGVSQKDVRMVLEDIEQDMERQIILTEKKRQDGRKADEVRPIVCEIGLLPRTHGSALFTRGQTQALVVVTLGTVQDEQRVDDLEREFRKSFMLHYNFLPFSTGEVRPMLGPKRREIGHGVLAERALKSMIPTGDRFPYTIRIVSDILESNGSTSMATVCGATLALMDAGVPIKEPVAGIAMGLIKEADNVAILTDILGQEDHIGDMDLKVAGTYNGITALQMDLKISGITAQLLADVLHRARRGRHFILDRMTKVISKPRATISDYAPRIITFQIKRERIRDVIGKGGKTIREIIEETGAKIDIQDDGTVTVASVDESAARRAEELIKYLSEEVEVGKIYMGKVTRVVNFGAFAEIVPGKEGLIHISELTDRYVKKVEDVLREGDTSWVKVIGIDPEGRINLSRKAALKEKGLK